MEPEPHPVKLLPVNNDTSIYLDWLQPFCATFEFFKFCSAIRKNAFRQISTIKLSRKEAKFLTLEEQRMKLSSMMFRVDSLLRPIVDPSTFFRLSEALDSIEKTISDNFEDAKTIISLKRALKIQISAFGLNHPMTDHYARMVSVTILIFAQKYPHYVSDSVSELKFIIELCSKHNFPFKSFIQLIAMHFLSIKSSLNKPYSTLFLDERMSLSLHQQCIQLGCSLLSSLSLSFEQFFRNANEDISNPRTELIFNFIHAIKSFSLIISKGFLLSNLLKNPLYSVPLDVTIQRDVKYILNSIESKLDGVSDEALKLLTTCACITASTALMQSNFMWKSETPNSKHYCQRIDALNAHSDVLEALQGVVGVYKSSEFSRENLAFDKINQNLTADVIDINDGNRNHTLNNFFDEESSLNEISEWDFNENMFFNKNKDRETTDYMQNDKADINGADNYHFNEDKGVTLTIDEFSDVLPSLNLSLLTMQQGESLGEEETAVNAECPLMQGESDEQIVDENVKFSAPCDVKMSIYLQASTNGNTENDDEFSICSPRVILECLPFSSSTSKNCLVQNETLSKNEVIVLDGCFGESLIETNGSSDARQSSSPSRSGSKLSLVEELIEDITSISNKKQNTEQYNKVNLMNEDISSTTDHCGVEYDELNYIKSDKSTNFKPQTTTSNKFHSHRRFSSAKQQNKTTFPIANPNCSFPQAVNHSTVEDSCRPNILTRIAMRPRPQPPLFAVPSTARPQPSVPWSCAPSGNKYGAHFAVLARKQDMSEVNCLHAVSRLVSCLDSLTEDELYPVPTEVITPLFPLYKIALVNACLLAEAVGPLRATVGIFLRARSILQIDALESDKVDDLLVQPRVGFFSRIDNILDIERVTQRLIDSENECEVKPKRGVSQPMVMAAALFSFPHNHVHDDNNDLIDGMTNNHSPTIVSLHPLELPPLKDHFHDTELTFLNHAANINSNINKKFMCGVPDEYRVTPRLTTSFQIPSCAMSSSISAFRIENNKKYREKDICSSKKLDNEENFFIFNGKTKRKPFRIVRQRRLFKVDDQITSPDNHTQSNHGADNKCSSPPSGKNLVRVFGSENHFVPVSPLLKVLTSSPMPKVIAPLIENISKNQSDEYSFIESSNRNIDENSKFGQNYTNSNSNTLKLSTISSAPIFRPSSGIKMATGASMVDSFELKMEIMHLNAKKQRLPNIPSGLLVPPHKFEPSGGFQDLN